MERKAGGGPGWGAHVNPWLIHVNVWQKTLQYCKVISLQLIKIKKKIDIERLLAISGRMGLYMRVVAHKQNEIT